MPFVFKGGVGKPRLPLRRGCECTPHLGEYTTKPRLPLRRGWEAEERLGSPLVIYLRDLLGVCIIYSAQCIIHSAQCIIYSAQCVFLRGCEGRCGAGL